MRIFKCLQGIYNKAFDWILDIDGCRTTVILKKSITGEPLLISGNGYLYKQTSAGLNGSLISVEVDQFGGSVSTVVNLLKGEYDYCLTREGKNSLVNKVRDRVSQGGKYLTTKRSSKGALDFIDKYWSREDLEQVKTLLLSGQAEVDL